MTTTEVLHALQVRAIRISCEGDRLVYNAPAGALTDEVLTLLRQHKVAMLAILAQPAHAAATAPSTPGPCTSQEHVPASPPPYPGHPVGAPFRPGQQVWLYRWDDQTPRFAAPVMIVQMRTLWPGEQDIGWCDAAGALSWHNARLAVAVETQEGLKESQEARQE